MKIKTIKHDPAELDNLQFIKQDIFSIRNMTFREVIRYVDTALVTHQPDVIETIFTVVNPYRANTPLYDRVLPNRTMPVRELSSEWGCWTVRQMYDRLSDEGKLEWEKYPETIEMLLYKPLYFLRSRFHRVGTRFLSSSCIGELYS